jgi:hypothetical protein
MTMGWSRRKGSSYEIHRFPRGETSPPSARRVAAAKRAVQAEKDRRREMTTTCSGIPDLIFSAMFR